MVEPVVNFGAGEGAAAMAEPYPGLKRSESRDAIRSGQFPVSLPSSGLRLPLRLLPLARDQLAGLRVERARVVLRLAERRHRRPLAQQVDAGVDAFRLLDRRGGRGRGCG